MKWFNAVFSVVLTVSICATLNTKFGQVPPLGAFFDPFAGFWQNAVSEDQETRNLSINTSTNVPVNVVYDELGIPHIFAKNEYDLYFAQGFVTARDRLWQMEFQTHAAGGRLSEILDEMTLEYDKYQRRIGMVYGAKTGLEFMKKDSTLWTMITAYTNGINAYINRLDKSEYPVEYKILDYEPEAWTPLKSALLMKYMGYTLSARNSELRSSKTLARLGKETFDALFNTYSELQDPIIPPDTKFNFKAELPKAPDSTFIPDFIIDQLDFNPAENNGSNNWAVSGAKTASGNPILANDPHLTLSLPSIWYLAHLNAPGINVMGATLPGGPGVIIGFNNNVAWGVTNTGPDVFDWYQIQFKDGTLGEYYYNDEWRATQMELDTIFVRGKSAYIDTLYFTHHGPVAYVEGESPFRSNVPVGHALRWIAHDPSAELLTFYKLNRAKNYEDYMEALDHFVSPAQNFVFIDRNNTIAIRPNGKFPLRWKGQGQFISDGSDPAYDWQGWVPREHNPHVKNPPRNFVSSANQFPADPNSYPYYLDWDFADYERGARINQRLAEMEDIHKEDMQALQLDNKSLHAAHVLPYMLEALRTDELSEQQRQLVSTLERWDYFKNASLTAPTVFDRWWNKTYNAIWSDDLPSGEGYIWPTRTVTAEIIAGNGDQKWIDNINSEQPETLSDIVTPAFTDAISDLEKEKGAPGKAWLWGNYQGAQMGHLGRIPGFSRQVFTGGGHEAVNAIRGDHGPSWRMIVELADNTEALGIYPGGQSGNPGSIRYDNFVDDWANGNIYKLQFSGKLEDINSTNILVLK